MPKKEVALQHGTEVVTAGRHDGVVVEGRPANPVAVHVPHKLLNPEGDPFTCGAVEVLKIGLEDLVDVPGS